MADRIKSRSRCNLLNLLLKVDFIVGTLKVASKELSVAGSIKHRQPHDHEDNCLRLP